MDDGLPPALGLAIISEQCDGVIVTDARRPDLPIVHVNRGFERLTGYTHDEVVGQNCRFLQADLGAENQAANNAIRAALEAGEACRVLVRNRRKDGSIFVNELSLFPLRDASPPPDAGGEIRHWVGLQHDVTAHADALRVAESASARKSALLTNASHELRAPLDAIVATATALAQTSLSPEQRRCVEVIHQRSEALDQTTSDIRELAQLEVDRATLGSDLVLRDLDILIVDGNATSRELLTQLSAGWGMRAQVTASPVEALAWVQRGRRYDLAALSVQTPEMSGVILASILRMMESTRGTPIVVLGPGDAFDTFTTTKVEALGGASILVKPIRRATLQRALVEAAHARHASGPAAATSPSRLAVHGEAKTARPLRVLVVEDNPVNREVAGHMLSRLGHSPAFAADGVQAVEAIQAAPGGAFDLVFMDVGMPRLDGLAATRQVRAALGASAGPYIIALTGSVMIEDRDACFAAGMNDFISKPIQLTAIAAALDRYYAAIGEPGAGQGPTSKSAPSDQREAY